MPHASVFLFRAFAVCRHHVQHRRTHAGMAGHHVLAGEMSATPSLRAQPLKGPMDTPVSVARLVEHALRKRRVAGKIPTMGGLCQCTVGWWLDRGGSNSSAGRS